MLCPVKDLYEKKPTSNKYIFTVSSAIFAAVAQGFVLRNPGERKIPDGSFEMDSFNAMCKFSSFLQPVNSA